MKVPSEVVKPANEESSLESLRAANTDLDRKPTDLAASTDASWKSKQSRGAEKRRLGSVPLVLSP